MGEECQSEDFKKSYSLGRDLSWMSRLRAQELYSTDTASVEHFGRCKTDYVTRDSSNPPDHEQTPHPYPILFLASASPLCVYHIHNIIIIALKYSPSSAYEPRAAMHAPR
ncbi:hypothetical protein AHF37_08117 [Paragonimus kellicotti]|nr:hypothetical protein AHF37_08117 [Paragonimus kellicotti]